MKKEANPYWYFSRAERSGSIALGVLCVVIFAMPKLFDRLKPPQPLDASRFASAIEDFVADTSSQLPAAVQYFQFNPNTLPLDSFVLLGLPRRTAASILRYREKGGQFRHPKDFQRIYNLSAVDYERLAPYIRIAQPLYAANPMTAYKKDKTSKALFAFDPNLVKKEDLHRLGLPPWVANMWINYLQKGGRFKTKEDLRKLYGLKESLYQQLEPFITLAPQPTPKSKELPGTLPPPKREPIKIDINQADGTQWELLKGIGPALADRIVRFREKLGGFSSVDHVAETRGLPDSVFQTIKTQLEASPIFRPININEADLATLQAHPYIGPQEAKALINYRQQHGPFTDAGQVARLKVWQAATLKKVLPYLVLE